MNTGQADASLLTLDNLNLNTMDSITIPTHINEVLIVPVGVTTFTEKQESAQKFVDFVSSDEGTLSSPSMDFPSIRPGICRGYTVEDTPMFSHQSASPVLLSPLRVHPHSGNVFAGRGNHRDLSGISGRIGEYPWILPSHHHFTF